MLATWGGVSFPLNPADFATSFVKADPVRALLLGLFSAAITAELGAVWTTVTNTLPVVHPLRGQPVIADTLELEPTHEIMLQRKAGFPLLALHRAVTEARTYSDRGQERLRTQPWHLHWILGPLEVGTARKLLDAGLLVEAVVDTVINQGRHEAFQGGAAVFGQGSIVDRIRLTQAEGPTQAPYGGDKDSGTMYWAIAMTLETNEVGSDTGADGDTGDPIFDGAAFSVGIGANGERLPDFVLGDTDAVDDVME